MDKLLGKQTRSVGSPSLCSWEVGYQFQGGVHSDRDNPLFHKGNGEEKVPEAAIISPALAVLG